MLVAQHIAAAVGEKREGPTSGGLLNAPGIGMSRPTKIQADLSFLTNLSIVLLHRAGGHIESNRTCADEFNETGRRSAFDTGVDQGPHLW